MEKTIITGILLAGTALSALQANSAAPVAEAVIDKAMPVSEAQACTPDQCDIVSVVLEKDTAENSPDTILILPVGQKYDFQAGDEWTLIDSSKNADFYESALTVYIEGSLALEAWIKRIDKQAKTETIGLYQLRCDDPPKVALLEQYQLKGEKVKIVKNPPQYRKLLNVDNTMEESNVFKKLCKSREES